MGIRRGLSVIGDRSCRMWAMREPTGNPRGGSAGGGTSAWSVGGGKVRRGRSMLCVSGVLSPGGLSGVQSSGVGARSHEANEMEGVQVVEAGDWFSS